MIPLLLLLACPGPKPSESAEPVDTSPETAETAGGDTSPPVDTTDSTPPETAETGDPGPGPLVATATLDEDISLVVTVSWTADPGTSWVEFGQDGALDRSTPVVEDTSSDHAFHLLGLPPETSIHWKAITVAGGVERSAEGDITTGVPPARFPTLTLNSWDAARSSPEPYFIGALTDWDGLLMAFDRAGQPLWYIARPEWVPSIVPIESLAATPDPDQVIVGAYSPNLLESESFLFRMTMEGDLLDTYEVGQAHHMSMTLADGTLVWLVGERKPWVGPDGVTYTLIGDAIMEMDPSGATRTVFTTWDWMVPEYDGPWPSDTSLELDWTHANTLFYYPENDTYLLSLANVDTALQINRTTGLVVRSYGTYGDFPVAEGSTPFHFQHDVNFTPTGTLLMTSLDASASEIFTIEYEVDTTSRVIREVWSYGKGQGIAAYCGGQARRLDNGNTWFNGGNAGVLREITPSGEVVWDLTPGLEGGAFLKMWPMYDFYDWYEG